MTTSGVATVLVRAADCGARTFLYWIWLDEPDNPRYIVVDSNYALDALSELESSLINEGLGYRAVALALKKGAFADPERERLLMRSLARAVLPEALAAQLESRAESIARIVIRVTPSPRLAQVPWELLVLEKSGKRVLEIAEVRYDAPSTVHARRAVRPGTQGFAADDPLRVVDPVAKSGDHRLGRLLPSAAERRFLTNALPGANVGKGVNRIWLGEQLRRRPPRFLYFGHVSSRPEDPASACIHLADDETTYGFGLAGQWKGSGHCPLSALDLLLGTSEVTNRRPNVVYPYETDVAGHRIWPMPPRVALIACESGGDAKSIETFGLVMAILNAGAELVTATRWKLPTNAAFQALVDDDDDPVQPTSDLLVAVDQMHESTDPFDCIRAWQRAQLSDWESSSTSRIVNTPLVWASLATYHVPTRVLDTVDAAGC